MFAAVDLGSNSFRFHIGAFDGAEIKIMKSVRHPIRLAAGLDSSDNLTPQSQDAALRALRDFRSILSDYKLDAVRVVATNTLRVARNAAAFLLSAEQAISYPIEVISGEEEGRLIYMGVACALNLPSERRLVVDIGGGSTELILGCGQDIEHVESFSVGTYKKSASFFPDGRIDLAAFEAAILSARAQFEDAVPSYKSQQWSKVYGSSGSIRAIANVIAKNGIGDGTLSSDNMYSLKEHLAHCGHVNDVNLLGIKPERVIVMTGALAILIGVMEEFGIMQVASIDAGLRMGVLWDLHLRATMHDRRDQSVQAFMRQFQIDEGRANRVAKASLSLYQQLKPESGNYTKHLYWSSLLHEIGLIIAHTGSHKHAAYIIENADLPGFTTREQRLMSTLVLGQKGNLRKIRDALSESEVAKAVLSIRLATMFMHSRIDADVAEIRVRMKNKIDLELRSGWAEQHQTLSFLLNKERDWWREVGVDMTVRISS